MEKIEKFRTTRRYYIVNKEAIGFIRFIFEGYDGIAVLTTENAAEGRVILTIAPEAEQEVSDVIESLKPEIRLTLIDSPQHDPEMIY